MATQGQLDFVRDIEVGVKALLAHNHHVTKITQVTEAAGRELIDLSAYVNRFAQSGQWDLIQRLAEAFLKVDLAPSCIAKALDSAPQRQIVLEAENIDPEPLELERSLPSIPEQLEELDRIFDVQVPAIVNPEPFDPSEPLQKVIQVLLPLPKSIQHRVISTASVWFGVGT
jgi:hypothetical protein